jgi:hypothetical protein
MGQACAVRARQVGDRAGDFERAMGTAGRPTHLCRGRLQESLGRRVQLGVGVDGLALEAVVGTALALQRTLARQQAALADAGGIFARAGAQQGFGGQGRNFDMQVNAVHEWTTQLGLVAVNLVGGAAAGLQGRAKVAAGAGVHGGDQLKPCWKFGPACGAGDRNGAGF